MWWFWDEDVVVLGRRCSRSRGVDVSGSVDADMVVLGRRCGGSGK